MRKIIGILILLVGVLALGLWAKTNHAKQIEADITNRSRLAISNPIHPLALSVSGRDIRVSGLVDNATDKTNILAQLEKITGRRTIVDQLKILQSAAPYLYSATRENGQTQFQGHMPTEAKRKAFAVKFGDRNLANLNLASSMPDPEWLSTIETAMKAFNLTEEGTLHVENMKLKFNAVVKNNIGEKNVLSILKALSTKFDNDIQLVVLDDGRPAEIAFGYIAGREMTISGKYPTGFDQTSIAKLLGTEKFTDTAKASDKAGSEPIRQHISVIGNWLGFFDKLEARSNNTGLLLEGTLSKGADLELIKKAITEAIDGLHTLTIHKNNATIANGETRANLITGSNEIATNGYWLPVLNFEATSQACGENTAQILAATTINFLTGSARLGAKATSVINRLSATVLHCFADNTLQLEVGGHTDSQGDDATNQGLSLQRASAVVKALEERGVEHQRIRSKGYGEENPIADNATKEGRARNRRTTFTWN